MEVYQLTPAEILGDLKTRTEGLRPDEIQERLRRYGHNQLLGKKKTSPVAVFFMQFLNPMVYILVAVATVKAFVKGPVDALVIVGVLLFMAIVGFVQEIRAERAMDALMKMTAPRAKVRRGGRPEIIPARDVVPGDIVILEAGDKVPADGRLLESAGLKVMEASLTGESVPVDKRLEAVPADAPLAERKNMIYTGTAVVYGRGAAIITTTGMQTEIGKIAAAIRESKKEKTSLQISIERLGHSLLWIILVVCTVLALLGIWKAMPPIEVFLMTIAAAVAAIPEALPAVMTVMLASGMQRMARHNAIIRKLVAVETLGSTTVICSDKTGTLTYNQMTVKKIYADESWFEVSGDGYEPKGQFTEQGRTIAPGQNQTLEKLLIAGCLCNDSSLRQEGNSFEIIGDPTEGALVVAAAKAGIEKGGLEERQPRLGEMPFQSERQLMATLHKEGAQHILYIKGAPEKILDLSDRYIVQGKELALTDAQREKYRKSADEIAGRAMRVLAFAYRTFPSDKKKIESQDIEGQFVLIGLGGMMDPPREEVRKAVDLCQKGGIKVVMATGDNPLTGQAIAKALGIRGGLNLTGRDLNQMSDDELEQKIDSVSVLARIEPLHKMRIVKAFKKRGQIVAMTGDGVNDAPALEAADIGVAMGITGTDVAKEASDMVLADDNFNSIVTAVEEGRAIFNRLRNAVLFMMTTCFGELLTLLLAVSFVGQAPLVPMQILWINLVTGALITIPLGLEPCVGDELSYPPRHPKVGLLFPGLLFRIFFLAGLLGLSSFGVFLWTLQHYELHEARTMTFCAIVIFELLVAFNARSDEATIFKLGFFKNRLLIKAIVLGALLQAAVVYLPFMHHVMDTVPLKWFEWIIAFIPGILIFTLETLRKIVAPRLFNWGKWQPVRPQNKKTFSVLNDAA